MAHYLVIVESPAKVKTIKKFLGSSYTVAASNGHVRDLPKSQLGVDPENDFEPKYITIRGKGDILANLRKEAKKADKVFLATDPDREGEAISWHLAAALKLDEKKMRRITFNEITKNAIKASLKAPREIDMDLVDAQQARRVLDRMVGYRISPLLWAKVKRGLSAGRVQSVALRIIADREAQIDAFIPEEYWTLDAVFKVKGERRPLTAKFYGTEKNKMEIHSKEELDQIKQAVEATDYRIADIKKGERIRKAPLPFTTSTLQQEAAKVLNFGTQKTMRIAQQLYEGVDIKGNGTVGVITYLRTDSTRISEEADAAARAYIAETYGSDYVAAGSSEKKTEKKIQDAHEAIRPSDITRTPAALKDSLTRDQFRLYQLIWKRFAASRMQPARFETTSVKIAAGDYLFTVATSRVAFEGFRTVYTEADEEKEESNVLVNGLSMDSVLTKEALEEKQHFTQPPAHYTEATLVKTLEELGIGRPSTYAPTISTILARRYITKEGKNLYMTEIGEVVNNIMKQSFPSIVDVNFTARTPAALKDSLTRDQFRLYQLIWKRFAASRMQPARFETTSVKIAAGDYLFTVATSRVAFEGFRTVYTEADEEKEESNVLVNGLSMDSVLTKEALEEKQHFTQPPAHYTEATLVKTLEELGIGRPSTYAPTISTILARRYITKEGKNLYMTEIGEVVNNIMKQSFPSIVDVNFTANMEGLLDMVEEGKVAWKEVIRNFYPDLDEAVKIAEKELESVKIEDEVTDVICEECGRNMVIKYGPHGKFLACPGFPECRNTKPYLEKIGVPCPLCGGEVVIRKTKKGRKYYGCENHPDCDFMSWQKPSEKKCPDCGGYMVEKGNKLVCADEKCGYVENMKKEE